MSILILLFDYLTGIVDVRKPWWQMHCNSIFVKSPLWWVPQCGSQFSWKDCSGRWIACVYVKRRRSRCEEGEGNLRIHFGGSSTSVGWILMDSLGAFPCGLGKPGGNDLVEPFRSAGDAHARGCLTHFSFPSSCSTFKGVVASSSHSCRGAVLTFV